jgi:hypothetical protein
MPKTPKASKKEETVDLEKAKKDLVAKAKKDGHIDQKDITAAIADTPENAEILDKLYTELADLNLQVTTAAVPVADDETVELSDEWVLEEGE